MFLQKFRYSFKAQVKFAGGLFFLCANLGIFSSFLKRYWPALWAATP